MLRNNTLLHNRYRIEKKIGQGGMGAVYKAYDEALRTMVAVKEAHVSDKALLAAFHMEAIRLARLRHPALPNVTDHFVDGHGQYLVMEYIEGEDLGEMLAKRGKPFSVAEVLGWGLQLLAVLEYLHRQQPPIIHRDIKPPNLKLMPDKTLILLDFGLAKGGVTTIHTITGSIPGYTIGYAPLEQIRQGYKSDARSDLYAVAATLWALLTAQQPVDAQVREQAANHGIPDPLRPANQWNPQVPQPIAQLLSQALALDAKSRPDSATTMQQQLQYEMQRATRERQQAEATLPSEEARRQAELTQFRRQAQQERLRRQQAEQDAETARRASQTKPSPQPTTLSPALVFGLIALILLALIAGGVISNSLRGEQEADLPTEASVEESAAAEEATEALLEPTEAPPEPEAEPEPTAETEEAAAEEAALGIGSTMVGEDGMTLMYVPAGEFLMGSEDSDAYDREKPEHTVNLDAYWIDKTEVTNEMYKACVNAGKCDAPSSTSSYDNPEYSNHPVVYVSWNDATTYCQWAGRRLPTEAEWEKAARGTDGRKYPWGDEAPTDGLANFNFNVGDTTPVGNYPDGASFYGALDMAGNVWEWVNDFYDENYYATSPRNSPGGPSVEAPRVLRGGSWINVARWVRAPYRGWVVVSGRYGFRGFRCAASDS